MKSKSIFSIASWRTAAIDEPGLYPEDGIDPIPESRGSSKSSISFIVWWAGFCIMQTLLVRFGTQSGYGVTALIDEVGFAISLIGFFAVLRTWAPRWLGRFLLLTTTVFLIVLAGGNQLYYDAFNSWAALYSLGQIGELGAIKSSVNSMLPYDVIVLWFCVPLLSLIGITKSWNKWTPRNGFAIIALGALLISAGTINRVNVSSPTENQLLLRAIRLESKRLMMRNAAYNPQKVIHGEKMSTLFAPMDGYTRSGDLNQPWVQKPLAAQAPTHQPNIIIIEAESFRAAESGAYGASDSLTPEFDKLAKQGLRAQNFYAAGMQTVRGEMAIHCSSYPALGDLPIYKRVPETDLTCLPEILKAAGYQNHWFSAFTSTYSGKRPFLESHGFQNIHGVETHGKPDDVHVGWGVSDEVMADRIIERLDRTEKPFLATWITLSNHHPWQWDYPLDFPEDLQIDENSEPYDHYRRGIYYTDHAIGYFVSKIREREWGKDAWIVIVGDHGMAMYPKDSKRSEFGKREAHFRVPMLVLAPGILEPGVTTRPASQVDITPTLIDMMGIKVTNAFVGQSILREANEPTSPVMLVGVNSASIIMDDKRCIASKVSCKEDETPRCASGQSPRAATHVCYKQTDDLLFNEDNGMQLLSEAEAKDLKKRLELMPAMQTHLEAHHRLGAGLKWQSHLQDVLGQN